MTLWRLTTNTMAAVRAMLCGFFGAGIPTACCTSTTHTEFLWNLVSYTCIYDVLNFLAAVITRRFLTCSYCGCYRSIRPLHSLNPSAIVAILPLIMAIAMRERDLRPRSRSEFDLLATDWRLRLCKRLDFQYDWRQRLQNEYKKSHARLWASLGSQPPGDISHKPGGRLP